MAGSQRPGLGVAKEKSVLGHDEQAPAGGVVLVLDSQRKAAALQEWVRGFSSIFLSHFYQLSTHSSSWGHLVK